MILCPAKLRKSNDRDSLLGGDLIFTVSLIPEYVLDYAHIREESVSILSILFLERKRE